MAKLDGKVYGVNLCAFLDTIAFAEGTTAVKGSDDGYNVLVGGKLFQSYERHPLSTGVWLPNLGIYSTAAGRYQILYRNWVVYRVRLSLKDFSPLSQDLIAYQMLKERGGVLEALENNDFPEAVAEACRLWASLPGAGYGQREVELASLQTVYQGFLPKDGTQSIA
jgi:muramidase (phage lysozyme)